MQFRRNLDRVPWIYLGDALYLCVHVVWFWPFFLMYFSMVYTHGSCSSGPNRQGISDDELRRIVSVEMSTMSRRISSGIWVYQDYDDWDAWRALHCCHLGCYHRSCCCYEIPWGWFDTTSGVQQHESPRVWWVRGTNCCYRMDHICWWVILYMLLSRWSEGFLCVEPTSLGIERMVEVRDYWLLTDREGHSDMWLVCWDVPWGVWNLGE